MRNTEQAIEELRYQLAGESRGDLHLVDSETGATFGPREELPSGRPAADLIDKLEKVKRMDHIISRLSDTILGGMGATHVFFAIEDSLQALYFSKIDETIRSFFPEDEAARDEYGILIERLKIAAIFRTLEDPRFADALGEITSTI